MEFIQLDNGALEASIRLASDTNVSVMHTTLDRQFHQQGECPPLGRTFALCRRALGPIQWMRRDFGRHSLAVFPRDRAFEATSWPGFDVLTITVSDPFLALTADVYELWHVLERLPPQGVAYECDTCILQRLRACCDWYLKIGEPALRLGAAFERQVMIARLALVAASQGAKELAPPPRRKRDIAFDRAIDLIRQMPAEGVAISELCQTIGASERTLRYAFCERVGVPPKAYIKALRLSRVRSTLGSASCGQFTVQDVATQWGFWHLSQFSHDYRKLFGELPSQTLRRAS